MCNISITTLSYPHTQRRGRFSPTMFQFTGREKIRVQAVFLLTHDLEGERLLPPSHWPDLVTWLKVAQLPLLGMQGKVDSRRVANLKVRRPITKRKADTKDLGNHVASLPRSVWESPRGASQGPTHQPAYNHQEASSLLVFLTSAPPLPDHGS